MENEKTDKINELTQHKRRGSRQNVDFLSWKKRKNV